MRKTKSELLSARGQDALTGQQHGRHLAHGCLQHE
jgi:hypothetical protein